MGERRGDEKKERAQGGGRAARKSGTEQTSQRHLCIGANWMDERMRETGNLMNEIKINCPPLD